MSTAIRDVLAGIGIVSLLTVLPLAGAAGQQTTTEKMKGTPKVTTAQQHGTVEYVEGNTLVVRTSTGQIEEFQVPESRKFMIDGKEVSVGELTPGTKLTATVTTTTTPGTTRTTTIGGGKVFYVSGNNVIITMPNNENKQFTVKDSYQFMVNGKPATIRDLRKGMDVSAEKIVESPHEEIAANTVVTGTKK
jgi:hypothetical protein